MCSRFRKERDLRRLETDLLTGAFWLPVEADKIGRGRRSLSGINQPAVAAGTLSGKRPLVSLMCAPMTARVSLLWGTAPGAWPVSVREQDSQPSAPSYDFAEVIAKQPPPVLCCASGKVESGSPGSSGREMEGVATFQPSPARPFFTAQKAKALVGVDGRRRA